MLFITFFIRPVKRLQLKYLVCANSRTG